MSHRAIAMIALLTVANYPNGHAYGDDIQGAPSPAETETSTKGAPQTPPAHFDPFSAERDAVLRADQRPQEKLDEIQSEALCVTVEKLIFEESYAAANRLNDFTNSQSILRTIYDEPRFKKLLTFAGSGHEAEQAEMIDCLKAGLERYTTELPRCVPEGARIYPGESVQGTRGASVAALLLAECDPEGRYLPLVARAHVRSQESTRFASNRRKPQADRNDSYIGSFDGAVFAAAEEVLLQKIAEGTANQNTVYDFPTDGLLQAFQNLDNLLDASIVDTPEHDKAFIRDLTKQPALYEIAILSLSTPTSTP